MSMAELYHVLAAIAMRAINLASGTSNNVYHADKVMPLCIEFSHRLIYKWEGTEDVPVC